MVTPAQMLAAETAELDIRFYAGAVDASELPSSYKRAGAVMDHIRDYGVADVVDCIDQMAASWPGTSSRIGKQSGPGDSRVRSREEGLGSTNPAQTCRSTSSPYGARPHRPKQRLVSAAAISRSVRLLCGQSIHYMEHAENCASSPPSAPETSAMV